jgi:HEPN domain-containing protein
MTHSIGYLIRLIEDNKVTVPKEIKAAKGLTQYAVDTRYPGPYDDIGKDEYEEALELAMRVYDWAQKMIEKS